MTYNYKVKRSLVPQLECVHVDTCLPDYFGGHHLAWVCIPIYKALSLAEIKYALHSELNQGAIGGSDKRTRDNSGEIGDTWFYRAHAAVDRIKPSKKGQRRFFADVETPDDDESDNCVYAYFVFCEA